MSRRIVRLVVAVGLALSMMLVGAGAALAFNPPDNAPDGVGADNLCAPGTFPAFNKAGFNPPGGFVGPWNATDAGFEPPNSPGPIDFTFARPIQRQIPDPLLICLACGINHDCSQNRVRTIISYKQIPYNSLGTEWVHQDFPQVSSNFQMPIFDAVG